MKKGITLKALLTFMSFSDSALSAFCDRIIKALTGNANYPDAPPFLITLKAAVTIFDELLPMAKGGSRVTIAEKNAAKADVKKILKKLCGMVNFEADGDLVKLLTSGFDITKGAKRQLSLNENDTLAVA